MIADFAAPSFHDGRGSSAAWTLHAVAHSPRIAMVYPTRSISRAITLSSSTFDVAHYGRALVPAARAREGACGASWRRKCLECLSVAARHRQREALLLQLFPNLREPEVLAQGDRAGLAFALRRSRRSADLGLKHV